MSSLASSLAALLLWILLSASPALSQTATPDAATARAALEAVIAKLDRSEIAKVEILEIPANVSARERITPSALETAFFYKLTIQYISGQSYRDFTAALKTLKIKSVGQGTDLRWGVIFYADDGSRVAGVYFNRWGTAGWVDNVPVVFQADIVSSLGIFSTGMVRWLWSTYGHCFER